MFKLGKFLALANLGQSVFGRWMFQQMLARIMVVAILTIITAMMVSALALFGLYCAYQLLLQQGMPPMHALAAIAGSIALITALLALVTRDYFRNLREMPKEIIREKSPRAYRAGDVIGAFFSGLTERKDY